MIAKDKIYHFIAGLAIAIIGSIILSPIEGIGLAIMAGVFKECYDHYTYDVFDVKDMVATWIGGAVGFALVSLINYWKS